MKNWAKSFEFSPSLVKAPASTDEAQRIIHEAIKNKKNVRMRGSAHSWTKLIETSDTFIHLDNMQGILNVDQDKKQITALAGTKLKLFGDEAFKHGLALPNQGDINHQSVAGAMSTGTHGTGITLQSMSNQLRGMTLISGLGDKIDISQDKNPELLKALAVSVGSAGLITETTLQMRETYKLRVESFAEEMSVSLSKFQERLNSNRHLEMFYFPMGDWSMVKLMNETQKEAISSSKLSALNDLVLENWFYEGLNILASQTKAYKPLDKLIKKFVSHKSFTNYSHLAFPSERTVKFMEMEFNIPIEKFELVFEEIEASIKKNSFQTLFPIEIRFAKGDDLWLSPAYGRDSVYFAVHTYRGEPYQAYFEELQKIFKRHAGRPHWGKWHSMSHDDLEQVYPKWQDFLKVRQDLDPQGLWLNPHLRSLFYKEP